MQIPGGLARASEKHPYNLQVFIAPPWAEIYANDAERKQNWTEAVATHDVMARVYQELGYALVPLPVVAPEERAAFVLRWIKQQEWSR